MLYLDGSTHSSFIAEELPQHWWVMWSLEQIPIFSWRSIHELHPNIQSKSNNMREYHDQIHISVHRAYRFHISCFRTPDTSYCTPCIAYLSYLTPLIFLVPFTSIVSHVFLISLVPIALIIFHVSDVPSYLVYKVSSIIFSKAWCLCYVGWVAGIFCIVPQSTTG